MRYRAEIDGLRAVAVVPVILFHAGFAGFSGGYVGVDVFFVISGYLITSIILSEQREGRFTLSGFYERRARRILPALFAVMAVSTLVALALLMPADIKEFTLSLAAVATFSSNFLFWQQSDYFATAAELQPMLHTWSLAVEEQYYILFPLFMLLAWRFGLRAITGLLVAAALVSLAAAQWGAFNSPFANFYLLPTRGWEILLGALAAIHLRDDPPPALNGTARQILSLAGLAMIAVAIVLFDRKTPFPSLYALLPTAGTLLLILFCVPGTLVWRLLSHRTLVFVGLISYSAYLWHQPLFAFARHYRSADPTAPQMAFLCLAVLPLAWLSWRFVERPFRQRGRIGRRALVASMSLCAAGFIAFGLIGHQRDGFERWFYDYRLSTAQHATYDLIRAHTDYDFYRSMVDDGACRFWRKQVDARFEERFAGCAERHGAAIVVLGDSHAMNLFNIVAKTELSPFVVGVAQGGCRPQANEPQCHYDGFDAFARAQAQAIRFVLFHQSGSHFVEDEKGEYGDDRAFEPGARTRFKTDYIRLARDYVTALNRTVPAYWLGPWPEARIRFRSRPVLLQGEFRINPRSLAIFEALEPQIRALVDAPDGLPPGHYLPFGDVLRMEADFLRVGDCLTFRDTDHFSRCGEDIVAREMPRLLAPLMR